MGRWEQRRKQRTAELTVKHQNAKCVLVTLDYSRSGSLHKTLPCVTQNGARGLSQVFLPHPRSVPLQVGEQGRVRGRHPEPAHAGAADPGVHDSSEGRAGLHHPPAAPDHTHPPGDGAEDLWPSLHQPGIPQGALATLLWDTDRGILPWEGGRGESSASGAARTSLGNCLGTPLPPRKFIKILLDSGNNRVGLVQRGSKSLNFLDLKV